MLTALENVISSVPDEFTKYSRHLEVKVHPERPISVQDLMDIYDETGVVGLVTRRRAEFSIDDASR